MEDLARLSIKNKPVYVGVDDAEQESTVDGLEQVKLVSASLCVFPVRFFLALSFVFVRFDLKPIVSLTPSVC